MNGSGASQTMIHSGGQQGGDGWFVMRADGVIAVLLFNLTRGQTNPPVSAAFLPALNSISNWPAGEAF